MQSKRFAAALAAGLVLSSAAFAAPAVAAPEALDGVDAEARHVPGELVVRYASDADRAHVREQYDLERIEKVGLPNTELVQVDSGTVMDTAAELTADPDVVYAEPNYVYRASALPDDTYFGRLWGLHQDSDVDIDAPEAWEVTTGSPAVTVAVVDTGVAINHPELASNVWHNPGETGGGKESNGLDDDRNGYVDDWQGWDWVADDATPRDLHGHGTHVAATIGAAANNASGIAGVAPTSKLMALRALNSHGEGTTADLASAFTYAGRSGAKVVNVSLGGAANSVSVLNAISSAPNTLFVVAAGNAGANNDVTSSYPCNYPVTNIVCVAAMDSGDRLAGFSNYGATTVDLAAPGVGILSLQPAFQTRFYEDFTEGMGTRWNVGGVNGTWGVEPDGSVSDSPGAMYQDNADSWIATASPVDLGGMTDCLLRYSMKLDVEERNDLLVIEASRDGSAWDRIGAWTGSTEGEWDRVTETFSDYDGAPAVHVRFRLVSNGLITGDGASLDSITLRCTSTTYTGSELLSSDGTSMATPHVAGAAALAFSAQPSAGPLTIARALADGADDSPAYLGKTVSGGRLNACRTVAIVASLPAERCGTSAAAATPSPTPSPSPTPTPTPSATPTATPTPTPSSSPSPTPTPSASPSPTATPSPTPSPSPTPTASPSPSPSPEASPEPEATPTPAPKPTTEPDLGSEPTYVHERTVAFRLSDDAVARGRIGVTGGYDACRSHVVVKIVRNGRVVGRAETRADGRFRVELADKPGRYRALVPEVAPNDTNLCAMARSRTRRI